MHSIIQWAQQYLLYDWCNIDSFLCTIDFSYIFIEDGNVFNVPTTFFFLFFCSHVLRLCFSVWMFMTQYFRWTAGVLTGPQLNGWRRKCLMLQIRHGVSKWYWNYQWVKTVLWYIKWFKSYSVDFRLLRARDCNILWLLLHHYFRYYIIKNHDKEFSILSLNTQSINDKFDKIYAIVNSLSSLGHYFGAIRLQETWLRNDADISLFNIPGHRLIHQGSKCTKHGGMIMYL